MTITSGPSHAPNSNHRFRADEALTKNAAGGNGFGLGSFRPILSMSFDHRLNKPIKRRIMELLRRRKRPRKMSSLGHSIVHENADSPKQRILLQEC
jgi:hypothetical protein